MNIKHVKQIVSGHKTLLQLMQWRELYQYVSQDAAFEQLQFNDDDPKQSVLVLAPHPNDEIFGCGGTIALHALHGDHIQVIYLTDGSRGTASGSRDKSLVALREQEARAGLDALGSITSHFWQFPDGRLEVNKTTTGLLKGFLEKMRPTIIYSPWFGDDHSDHATVNTLLVDALMQIKEVFNVEIRQYEEWTPLVPNRIAGIGQVIDQKMRALEAHKSQLGTRSYRDGLLGLNAYRGAFAGLDEPAEAFFSLPRDRFLHFNQYLLPKLTKE